MMRAVFYSGGQTPKNHQIHEALVALFPRKKRLSMTYIPVWKDGSKVFFARARRRYERFGVTNFRCLPIDAPFSAREMEHALKSDMVYLAGGNTYYYLYHLKKAGLLGKLRKYSRNGGVLAGLSAGGLIMTPHLGLASYPKFERDENLTPLKDFEPALNLVKFEFFPHYHNSKKLVDSLKKYSKSSQYPLLAVPDGGGIILDNEKTTYFGEVSMFHKGKLLPLST